MREQWVYKELEMKHIFDTSTFLPDNRAINRIIFIILNQLGNIELMRNLCIANAQKPPSRGGAKTTN